MPYITQDKRKALDSGLEVPRTPGELNYAVTQLVITYLKTRGKLRYDTINEVVGALESAKAEFQRRVVTPYEDNKISENGDVYDVMPLFR